MQNQLVTGKGSVSKQQLDNEALEVSVVGSEWRRSWQSRQSV
jgi:hypothetical protein